MRRALTALMWADARMLWRTGYVQATAVILVILLALLIPVSRVDFAGFADVVTAVILIDQVVMPVMLVGFLILHERGEGSLAGLAVTPVAPALYLASKMIVVGLVCSAEMMVLVLVVYDGALSISALVTGLFAMAALSTLAGVVAIAPFDSVFRAILPMIGWAFLLGAPGYSILIGRTPLWLDLWPTGPAVALLQSAFEPTSAARLAFAAAGATLWTGAWFALAMRSYRRAQARAAGA